jgi:hypothetical protein
MSDPELLLKSKPEHEPVRQLEVAVFWIGSVETPFFAALAIRLALAFLT